MKPRELTIEEAIALVKRSGRHSDIDCATSEVAYSKALVRIWELEQEVQQSSAPKSL